MKEKEGIGKNRQKEPEIEIDEKVPQVKMPGLGAVDIGTFARVGKEVVKHDVERNAGQASYEEAVDSNLKPLEQV